MTAIVKHFNSFNFRRYSDPWVARVDRQCRPDFSVRVGTFTGGFRTGHEGDLVLTDPVDGALYTWGQKDYRGGNTARGWFVYQDGEIKQLTYAEALDYATAQ